MLRADHISAGYDKHQVLFDISFSLQRGENVSIIGPNGSGKSTLLRALAHIIPFQGDVLLEGRSIRRMKRKQIAQKIALLSQITNLYFNFSVLETVSMGRYSHSAAGLLAGSSEKDEQIVEETLRTVHMWDYKDRDIATLSGGQLQRVYLAKILAQQPDIILLDEPTNHLDLAYQIELSNFLRDWSRQNDKSVIGVLHDINLAAQFSDRLILLDKGRIVASGTTHEVLNAAHLQEIYHMDVNRYMVDSLRVWEKLA